MQTKALISFAVFAVTAKLICVFFRMQNVGFSHDAAHISMRCSCLIPQKFKYPHVYILRGLTVEGRHMSYNLVLVAYNMTSGHIPN